MVNSLLSTIHPSRYTTWTKLTTHVHVDYCPSLTFYCKRSRKNIPRHTFDLLFVILSLFPANSVPPHPKSSLPAALFLYPYTHQSLPTQHPLPTHHPSLCLLSSTPFGCAMSYFENPKMDQTLLCSVSVKMYKSHLKSLDITLILICTQTH